MRQTRLSYLLVRWTFASAGIWLIAAAGNLVSMVQKIAQRISS